MEKRGMDLETLAGLTGLAPDFLTTMLDQEVYPPLGPLMKIARALGVRLGTFLDDQENRDPFVARSSDRPTGFTVPGARGKSPALNFFSLGSGKTDRHMEPFFVELLPESALEKKLSSHEGEEFIVVVSGTVEVIHGTETHVLEPGDSIYYNSVVPHYVSCAGPEKASIHAVIYIPE
jgi:mannose-6-phosphate isomerase-like protein (cupin superfamily)